MTWLNKKLYEIIRNFKIKSFIPEWLYWWLDDLEDKFIK